MRRYTDTVASAVTGLPVANAQVRVLNSDGSQAQLYSDIDHATGQGVTTLTQPVLTDSLGQFYFYVADGTYTLTIDYTGSPTKTLPDVEIFSDAEANPLAERALLVPEGESQITIPGAAARANKFLAFDATGLPIPAVGGGGGGIGVSTTDDLPEGTTNRYYTDARARSSVSAGPGLAGLFSSTALQGVVYNSATGQFSNPTQDGREVWVHDFYNATNTTDVLAIKDAILWASFVGAVPSCITIKFKDRRGLGPNGIYLIDSLIDITSISSPFLISTKVILDFGDATIRYTSTSGGFVYTEPSYLPAGNLAANSRYFVVRGGIHQYAAVGIPFLFKWSFQYSSSRLMGTGFAEDMRIIPQTDSGGYTLRAPFLLKNTWDFSATNVHYCGPPSQPPLANTYFIEQTGACIVTEIDKCETSYTAEVIKYGYATQTGINGTFTSGTYAKGKALRQGAAIGYFGRNDGGYGFTYSLFDVTGTFVTGAADLLDSVGNVVGSFNITTATVYYQPSEAISVGGGSNFIQCNYFVNWSPPDANTHMLDIQLSDAHVACYVSAIAANGIDNMMAIGFNAQPYPSASTTTNVVMFDITNGSGVVISGSTSTTNDGHTAGTKDYRFVRLRNVNGFTISGNVLTYYDIPVDLDNTCKDGSVFGNGNQLNTCGKFVNTGNRFQGNTSRGIRFYNNGSMGAGIDIDDPNTYTWVPTVTADTGSITAYTVPDARYNISNGVFHFHLKVVVSNSGTAGGGVLVSMPTLLNTAGANLLNFGFFVPATINNNLSVSAFFDNTINKIRIGGDRDPNGFKIDGVQGNFTYWVNGSVPLAVS